MPKYAVTGEAATGAGLTTLEISAQTAARRFGVYDFIVSCNATPADNVFDWVVQRHTASGTRGSVVVPSRLDIADAEFAGDAGQDHTIEPTYTATEEMIDFSVNHRATFRWVAAPDGEMVAPATDNAGIGWESTHPSDTTSNQKVTAHMWE